MICAKDMRQHILSQWFRDAIVAMFGICARYAPATVLARHLDPAGTRPGSHQIPSGASVCVRGMRWGRNPTGLPKLSLEEKRICAGYALATFLARHLNPAGTRPRSCWNPSRARVCVRGVRWSRHALSVAKVPLDKNRSALSMRWPHSSLENWIHAEHDLDSAKTLVSLRYLCAGSMRPISIYAG